MKRVLGIGIPTLFAGFAVALTLVLAQPAPEDKTFAFTLDADITAQAGEVAIEPKFNAVADDRFPYELHYNAVRSGTVNDGVEVVDSFRVSEAWSDLFTLGTTEDPLDGRKDLQLRLNYEMIKFTVDNGDARYSGYIGPQMGSSKPSFQEIGEGNTRTDVTNIPGWAGINAGAMEANRRTQGNDFAGTAVVSVADTGRLYNETYFADWGNSDQTNYPGRIQEPLQLMLAVQPEFAAGAKLKIGETSVVRRRFPVSAAFGGSIDYDVTYTLEKLYGTVAEPTAARFKFDAVPVQREQSLTINGIVTKFSAPDIKGGSLLMDLRKGVAAYVAWKYELSGTVTQPGTALLTAFDVKVDFTASLRKVAKPE